MNKDNFDIKTFSAENIRIMQEKEISNRGDDFYEHLALEIYEKAKNNTLINEHTATTYLDLMYARYVYHKFEEKGFLVTFTELGNDDNDYKRFKITVSW
jgi:DNA-dependent RNA polymerase auxiliary subunit epsilon